MQDHPLIHTSVRQFVFGGHATFTIRSKRTLTRYTYKVSVCQNHDRLFFVSLLTAPDAYTYIGVIDHSLHTPSFRLTGKSKFGGETLPVKAIHYLLKHLEGAPDLEFFHAGACCRCGRELTDPESIDRGIGPVCAGF